MGFARSAPPTMQSGFTLALPDDLVFVREDVPFQTDTTTYDEMKALKIWTLFPVLDKPFKGRGMR